MRKIVILHLLCLILTLVKINCSSINILQVSETSKVNNFKQANLNNQIVIKGISELQNGQNTRRVSQAQLNDDQQMILISWIALICMISLAIISWIRFSKRRNHLKDLKILKNSQNINIMPQQQTITNFSDKIVKE